MATVSEIIDLIHNSELSLEDRVAILRALRDTIPDLIAPDYRLKGRIDAARGIRPEYVDSAITGLENSQIWQQSAATTPKTMRIHRTTSDSFRPLIEESLAFAKLLDHNARYHHFLAVDMARTAHRVGKELIGEAAIHVKPHLDIMADARPFTGRRRNKPTNDPTPTTPPSAKE